MKIGIFQLNGCTKCRNETIILNDNSELKDHEIIYFDAGLSSDSIYCDDNNKSEISDSIDVAVFTGYATSENKKCVEKIRKVSKVVYSFGSCATDGGIFGLVYQKGVNIIPVSKIISVDEEISGCLSSHEELIYLIKNHKKKSEVNLCEECQRESTCDFLEEIVHQVNLEELDEKQCFNDVGYVCSGYIAKNCQERCIDYGTPCRGCKPLVDDSSVRMLGMMGTLMGQMDVATEASEKGATDKLADMDDDISNAYSDIVGTFFRFTLPTSSIPLGKIPSSGNILADIMIKRPIEELPLLTGMMGGKSFISLTLDVIEAYENGINQEIGEEVKNIRKELRSLEVEYKQVCKNQVSQKYIETTQKIRNFAGNMNLSNLYYGGMKTKLKKFDEFDKMRAPSFIIQKGEYSAGKVKFSIDSRGIITNWENDDYEF